MTIMRNKYRNEIHFLDPGKLLVIQVSGKIKELYVPIRMTTMVSLNKNIPPFTIVHIEEIQLHREHRLLFRIFGGWYPYWAYLS